MLCGPDEDVHKNATSSAQAIATGFAEAITEIVANCFASMFCAVGYFESCSGRVLPLI